MPFGLTNAVFQALVKDVLRDMLNHFVFVYLDDIRFLSNLHKNMFFMSDRSFREPGEPIVCESQEV
jgi:hypothetical protein